MLIILYPMKNINLWIGSVLIESPNGGCLVGVMVGVEATPTHPTSPVKKGTPSVFYPFLVGVDEKFLKIYPST